MRFVRAYIALAVLCAVHLPGTRAYLLAAESLEECGRLDSFKHADARDTWQRECRPSGVRKYQPRYAGLGYEILDSESEACFVPDEAYVALDRIMDDAVREIRQNHALETPPTRSQALAISATIGKVLSEHGFGVFIPTDNFADAMIQRNDASEPERHAADCDTSSFIYLTIAENLKLPLSLVEVKLSAHSTHNYVRWDLGSISLDWDTNGNGPCQAPTNILPFQGKSMTRKQTLGYARRLRSSLWEKRRAWDRALVDLRFAVENYPESSHSWNELAWLVATRQVSNRRVAADEALSAAQRAVSILRTANNLDTLACVYALQQRFREAVMHEAEAVAMDPENDEFIARLISFTQHHDCTIPRQP